MLPYVKTPPQKWPYQQIIPMDRSELVPVFRSAAVAYGDPRYEQVVASFSDMERASLRLLNPIPGT